MKKFLVHNIFVARQHKPKMLVGVAAVFSFRIFSKNFSQAYIQRSEELQRNILDDSQKELNLGQDQLVRLLKPLHRLSERGECCERTFRNHLEEQFGMK